jgi:hypothetical protein
MKKKNISQHHDNIKYSQVNNLILKKCVEVMSPWLGRYGVNKKEYLESFAIRKII